MDQLVPVESTGERFASVLLRVPALTGPHRSSFIPLRNALDLPERVSIMVRARSSEIVANTFDWSRLSTTRRQLRWSPTREVASEGRTICRDIQAVGPSACQRA